MLTAQNQLAWPPKFDLFGIEISRIDYQEATDLLINAAQERYSMIVDHMPVHGLIEASSDPALKDKINQFDIVFFQKMLNLEGKAFSLGPFHWLPIDFGSVLFALGIDPESYFKNEFEFVRNLGIDPTRYRQHHALDDAKLLRDVYLKLASTS